MRIATYNVEWFSALFDTGNRLFDDTASSARHKVTRAAQTRALVQVFRALDADAIMIIEAPDQSRRQGTVAALTNFAAHAGLRAQQVAMGYANDTQQEIALLYDADKLFVHHAPGGRLAGPEGATGAPRFDSALRIDLDIDAEEDLVVFSKPPLELAAVTHRGFEFKMIGAHLKSKAPHGAKSQADAMRIGIANRRKQLAQAIWLRRRVDERLAEGSPLIVLGDLNDGPGLDTFEDLFGHSSVEIVMGHRGENPLFDPNALRALSQRIGAMPTTARFWIETEKRFLQALLDYVLVSPEFVTRNASWRIWHPLDDPDCWNNAPLREALLTASDHFPVTLDFDD